MVVSGERSSGFDCVLFVPKEVFDTQHDATRRAAKCLGQRFQRGLGHGFNVCNLGRGGFGPVHAFGYRRKSLGARASLRYVGV